MSYDNCVYLAGACNVGKSTLASILIGEEISQHWKSTDGLTIYFGRNGIDLKTKEMVPLNQGNTSKHFSNILLNGKKSWKMFFFYLTPGAFRWIFWCGRIVSDQMQVRFHILTYFLVQICENIPCLLQRIHAYDKIIQNPLQTVCHFSELMNYTM